MVAGDQKRPSAMNGVAEAWRLTAHPRTVRFAHEARGKKTAMSEAVRPEDETIKPDDDEPDDDEYDGPDPEMDERGDGSDEDQGT